MKHPREKVLAVSPGSNQPLWCRAVGGYLAAGQDAVIQGEAAKETNIGSEPHTRGFCRPTKAQPLGGSSCLLRLRDI